MRSFLIGLLRHFLTPWGLVFLGALDSSLIFFLPLGIDFSVVIVSARKPDLFWLNALLATAGSVVGSGITFWIGKKIGEHGLRHLISPSRLTRVQARVKTSAAITVGALSMIPPPFPFTALVLTTGALGANPWRFLITLGVGRLMRFGIEAILAVRYGRRILIWMESPVFDVIVGALIAFAIVGTIISAVAVVRSTRGGRQTRV